jgi:cell division protein FtsI (penicillin-binding protein 3)
MSIIRFFTPARVQNHVSRQTVAHIIFAIFFGFLVFYILTYHDNTAKKRGIKQSDINFIQVAKRGNILDRNGEILANSLTFKQAVIDTTLLTEEFIPLVVKALKINTKTKEQLFLSTLKEKYGRKNWVAKKNIAFNGEIVKNIRALKKKWVCHKKKLTTKEVKQEASLINSILIFLHIQKKSTLKCNKRKIGYGISLQDQKNRYYPKSNMLAPLIGRVILGDKNKKDKVVISGIESSFNATLSGVNGQTSLTHKYAKNYFSEAVTTPLKNGKNIHLTIDSNIQYQAYRALKKSVLARQADSGSAIILNPKGEVLAMVNYPTDDPNNRHVFHASHYENYVLSSKIEPGSIMKPFTMLLALDEGKISANDSEKIDVTKRIGHIKPKGRYKFLNVKQILQKSHNLGTVNVVSRLDKASIYNTWNKLGFGHSLGLLPDIETSGTLKHFSRWHESDKHSISYGYGPMQANLAQLARAYLVFANQGKLPVLSLVKGVYTQEKPKQIFSAKSTQRIAQLLNSVVSDKGSGRQAQIQGYQVAGKTGTAEMLINGVYNKNGKKRTFFAGFVPVDKPKYIMAVRLDYPKKCQNFWSKKSKPCYGSNSAALVFQDALQKILSTDETIKPRGI